MNFKIIDLFAGIGGIRLGIENAIYKNGDTSKCVFSSEIDKYAIQTYITNFGKTNFYGDITNLKDDKNIKKIIPSLLNNYPHNMHQVVSWWIKYKRDLSIKLMDQINE